MILLISFAKQLVKTHYYLSSTIALICSIYIYDLFTKPKRFNNIFEIPNYPIIGNLAQLKNNPAKTLMEWSTKYNTSIFQIRLGNKRIIVVNSFDFVSNLWTKNACKNNSRPINYTFHSVVSSTQGFTIGSTPSIPSCIKAKKTLAMNFNSKSLIQSNIMKIIDLESLLMIKKLFLSNIELAGPPSVNTYRNKSCQLADIDLISYAQTTILKMSILISFGIKLTDNKLISEIIEVEGMIMNFRSPLGNWADYLPMLRILDQTSPNMARSRRDVYMNYLFKNLNDLSLLGKLQIEDDLSEKEIRSIALSLVSAGLDNTPLNFNHLMGHLSQKYGYKMQNIAFKRLIKMANNNIQQAWNDSITMNCDYVIALVHETLRFFTVLPLSLPRSTSKPINFSPKEGSSFEIPANTTLFMNAYAANHDKEKFESPYSFNPERWLTSNSKLSSDLTHFAFGAGSRKCTGNDLAIHQLYTLTCRMVLMFKILPPVTDKQMELDPFKNNLHPSSITFEPKVFKVKLEPRVYPGTDDLYNKIVRTQDSSII